MKKKLNSHFKWFNNLFVITLVVGAVVAPSTSFANDLTNDLKMVKFRLPKPENSLNNSSAIESIIRDYWKYRDQAVQRATDARVFDSISKLEQLAKEVHQSLVEYMAYGTNKDGSTYRTKVLAKHQEFMSEYEKVAAIPLSEVVGDKWDFANRYSKDLANLDPYIANKKEIIERETKAAFDDLKGKIFLDIFDHAGGFEAFLNEVLHRMDGFWAEKQAYFLSWQNLDSGIFPGEIPGAGWPRNNAEAMQSFYGSGYYLSAGLIVRDLAVEIAKKVYENPSAIKEQTDKLITPNYDRISVPAQPIQAPEPEKPKKRIVRAMAR